MAAQCTVRVESHAGGSEPELLGEVEDIGATPLLP